MTLDRKNHLFEFRFWLIPIIALSAPIVAADNKPETLEYIATTKKVTFTPSDKSAPQALDSGSVLEMKKREGNRGLVMRAGPLFAINEGPEKWGWIEITDAISLDEHIKRLSRKKMRAPTDVSLLKQVAVAYEAKAAACYRAWDGEEKTEGDAMHKVHEYQQEALSAISCAITLQPDNPDLYNNRFLLRHTYSSGQRHIAELNILDLQRHIELLEQLRKKLEIAGKLTDAVRVANEDIIRTTENVIRRLEREIDSSKTPD